MLIFDMQSWELADKITIYLQTNLSVCQSMMMHPNSDIVITAKFGTHHGRCKMLLQSERKLWNQSKMFSD